MTSPPGFATVTPYLFVDGADEYLAFLAAAFGAEDLGCSRRPDGKVANAQRRIGNAVVMVSEASPEFPAMASSHYLYVDNAGQGMDRAIAAGAREIMKVANMPYGDRQGGVRDSAGNIWWISQRLERGGYFD